jgi:hypothetical protein
MKKQKETTQKKAGVLANRIEALVGNIRQLAATKPTDVERIESLCGSLRSATTSLEDIFSLMPEDLVLRKAGDDLLLTVLLYQGEFVNRKVMLKKLRDLANEDPKLQAWLDHSREIAKGSEVIVSVEGRGGHNVRLEWA